MRATLSRNLSTQVYGPTCPHRCNTGIYERTRKRGGLILLSDAMWYSRDQALIITSYKYFKDYIRVVNIRSRGR